MGKKNLHIGILGMILLLTAFILTLLNILTQEAVIYILLNIVGGGLSVYYAAKIKSLPFIILEAVWTFFAVYKMALVLIK